MTAENPTVPQPGFVPLMMSLKLRGATSYDQVLRNPSAGSPSEIRNSFSSEMMPAMICRLVLS